MLIKRMGYGIISSLLILQTLSPVAAFAEQNDLSAPQQPLGKKSMKAEEKRQDYKPHERMKEETSQSQDGKNPAMALSKLSDKSYQREADILSFLEERKAMLGLHEPKKEFTFKRKTVDKKSNTHYRFQQQYEGIPVYGAEVIVHTDRRGLVYAYSSEYQQPERMRVETKPSIGADRAVQLAQAYVEQSDQITLSSNVTKGAEKNLVIYPFENQYYLAYQIEITYQEPKQGRWIVFVDARSGNIIHGFDRITDVGPVKATGIGYFGEQRQLEAFQGDAGYFLRDTTRGQADIDTYDFRTYDPQEGIIYNVADPDGHFSDQDQKTAVDVHFYAGQVYDYFKKQYNRLSYDNLDSPIPLVVHVPDEDGGPMNNAFWNGIGLFFGDGDGYTFSPLGSQLDVVGHEFAHGVTEYSAGLEYYGQSGALNESVSDIFGALIEGDWEMGEKVFTPGISGDALRSLEDPTLYNQPDHMNQYVYTNEDNGGVHINSGIPNKAAYLIATKLDQQGMNGKEILGQLTYWALTHRLTVTSNFSDAYDGFLLAAETLYGQTPAVYKAVDDAWKGVGVSQEDSTVKPNDPYEINDTPNQAAAVSWGTYKPSLSSPHDQDWFKVEVAKETELAITFGDFEKYIGYGPYTMEIYDANLHLINSFNSELLFFDEELPNYGAHHIQPVEAGTYYLKVFTEFDKTSPVPYLFTLGQDSLEPNDIPQQGAPIAIGDSIQSYISNGHDQDFYKLVLTEGQMTEIRLTELPGDYHLALYDSEEYWITESSNDSNTDENIRLALAPGTYYIQVFGVGESSSLQPYRLSLKNGDIVDYDAQFTGYQEYAVAHQGSEFEVIANVTNSGKQPWKSNLVRLEIAGISEAWSDGTTFESWKDLEFGETWYTSIQLHAPNKPGQYMVPLQLVRFNTLGEKVPMGPIVQVALKVVDDSFEPNNWFFEATPIQGGKEVVSKISYWGDQDFFTFTLDHEQDVDMHLSGMSADYDLYLYQEVEDGNIAFVDQSENSGLTNESISKHLMPGTYYINVFSKFFAETGDPSYHLLLNAQTAVNPITGDFDHDGDADQDDLTQLKNHYGQPVIDEMDMNKNESSEGVVDLFDFLTWIKKNTQ